MKKYLRLFLIIVATCLLFTSCTSAEERTSVGGNIVDSQKVQNLEKLCKVWGYTKYNHPVFLFGEKDWDEELLKLIPMVSESKEEEVNKILHEWFVSLGEIDYGTSRPGTNPLESEAVVQADTSWTLDETYLGEELLTDLQQLRPIPGIDRSEAPVKFSTGQGVPDFTNEKSYPNTYYDEKEERLLGLFRIWNVIEYYFPYLNIMDESWDDLLTEYIPKMLEASDLQSFEMALSEMTAHLHDAHVMCLNDQAYRKAFGKYTAPVNFTRTKEGQWVVSELFRETTLEIGDVILKLDGTDIKEVEENRKQYISVPNNEKLFSRLRLYLLSSQDEEMEITVLRDGKEQTISVKGSTQYYNMARREAISHEILDGNIGLINPSALPQGDTMTVVRQVMNDLQDTDGLIIDLRQYPSHTAMHTFLSMYFQRSGTVYNIMTVPSQSVPGTFVKQKQVSFGVTPAVFYYEKPVVLLMDEGSWSNSECSIMDIRTGDNVTVLGSNSIGSDGDIADLPLPNGNQFRFTSCGVYTPEMGQTQRIGLTPNIEIYPTIESIKEGRDELMEAAVEYLSKK